VRAVVVVAALTQAAPALATPEEDAKRDEAKRLFQYGNDLRRAGDCDRALEYFVKSRALFPTASNTLNCAICLDQIRRYDEALELYEELLTRFSDKLDADTKAAMTPAMANLRTKVGAVEVSANVEGAVLVGSRMRGTLPRSAVRVLPGQHRVRVIKDGYETFETTVQVKVGETVQVDARLTPLASAGRMRVEGKELEAAEIFVDGALLGRVPWEGTLAPGDHVFWVRKGDQGSAPKRIIVVQGQTVLVETKMTALGPEVRFVAEPSTALMWLDGVQLGAGVWQGRLPLGEHTMELKEQGYFQFIQKVVVTAETRGDVRLVMKPDRKHPRWGVAASGHFLVDVFGGMPLAGSLGSSAEGYCDSGGCPSRSLVIGWIAGARASYELPMGLGFGLGVGYMGLRTRLTRTVNQSFSTSAPGTADPVMASSQYALDDTLEVRGPMAFGGVSYRRGLGARFTFEGRLEMGVWLTGTSDTIGGSGSAGGVTRSVSVSGSGVTSNAAAVLVMPGIAMHAKFSAVRVGLGVTAVVLATGGPTLETGDTRVNAGATCDRQVNGWTIDCAPDASFTRGEKGFGRFIAVIPAVTAGYEF
jgi:hypothetical protein